MFLTEYKRKRVRRSDEYQVLMEDLVKLGIVTLEAYEGLLQRTVKVGARLTPEQEAFFAEKHKAGKNFSRLDVIGFCDKANVRTTELRIQVLADFGFDDGTGGGKEEKPKEAPKPKEEKPKEEKPKAEKPKEPVKPKEENGSANG
jgi:hypothetical protein